MNVNNYKRQKSTLKEATEETKKEYIKNICDEKMEFKKKYIIMWK
jgi:hypothetical protein